MVMADTDARISGAGFSHAMGLRQGRTCLVAKTRRTQQKKKDDNGKE